MADTSDDQDRVELTELDVITRYSLAVRSATADRSELVDILRADLAWLEAGRRTAAGKGSAARKATTGRGR
jgi:hypothetical protein